jgi:hypothetical protein
MTQTCIRSALKQVSGFELETATRNATGSPDIAATILAKIDKSNMMIADVTIINATSRKARKTPNPNVMYELGYAVKALGEQNIILIADKRLTDTSNLPFDIRNRRMILIDFEADNAERFITDSVVAALKGHVPQDSKDDAPQAFLSENYATWASNYSGHGASFRSVISIDNYGGKNDYITNVKLLGTNGNGTPFATDEFTFEREQKNRPHPIQTNEMQTLAVFLGSDSANHRPMPDLDRNTVNIEISFRSSKIITLPIHIRQG